MACKSHSEPKRSSVPSANRMKYEDLTIFHLRKDAIVEASIVIHAVIMKAVMTCNRVSIYSLILERRKPTPAPPISASPGIGANAPVSWSILKLRIRNLPSPSCYAHTPTLLRILL
jgi:hypothetical protein